MAHATISFENPQSGQMREAPVGFSWTVLFFGFFPALFRSHWVGFAIIALASFATFGLSNLLFMFIYNRMYVKHLISEGFRAKSASADLDGLEHKLAMKIPRLGGMPVTPAPEMAPV